jgi:hypothetical protein
MLELSLKLMTQPLLKVAPGSPCSTSKLEKMPRSKCRSKNSSGFGTIMEIAESPQRNYQLLGSHPMEIKLSSIKLLLLTPDGSTPGTSMEKLSLSETTLLSTQR